MSEFRFACPHCGQRILCDSGYRGTDINAPGNFFDVEYKIRPRLTAGKHQVVVRFQTGSRTMAGGVFGCQMLRR